MKKEDPPNIAGLVASIISKGSSDPLLLRMILNDEDKQITTQKEFTNGYNQAISTIYSILKLIDIKDAGQVKALEEGIKQYINHR